MTTETTGLEAQIKRNALQVLEDSAAAQAILDSDVFKMAHLQARRVYFQELLAQPVGSLTAQHAHAKLLALEDVVSQLKSFVTEEKMRARNKG